MPKPETITMTMRELDRFKVVQAVADQGLAIWRAAERLGLSRRQVERRVCAGVHGGLQCALCQVAKLPRSDFDAHRPLRGDEDLARIFCWREWRKVSASLTLQYAKVTYLLEDRPEHRKLVHRYLEVAEYPDGTIELWADGASLPYTTYDRLTQIDQGAIVEHKRLGHVLAVAAELQAQRDDRRQVGPSRTLVGEPPRPKRPAPQTKRQRLINRLDLERASHQHHRPTNRPQEESNRAQSARPCRHLNLAASTTTKNRLDTYLRAGTC